MNSYWLLYLIALFPLIILVLSVSLVLVLAFYWRNLSGALGWGIASKRAGKKENQLIRILVFIGTWSIALVVLALHRNPNLSSSNSTIIAADKVTNGGGPPSTTFSSLGGTTAFVSNLVRSDWLFLVFLGLLVVSVLIFVRGVKVSMDLTKQLNKPGLFEAPATEGLSAVKDAIKIVQESNAGGPRERIVACYERMITAASHMGASVTPDLTARELERSIRKSFMLKGEGIRTLTGLFEEARYSLHPMTEEDSQTAYSSLVSIQEELRSEP